MHLSTLPQPREFRSRGLQDSEYQGLHINTQERGEKGTLNV
jgi:hypothetical protein